MTVSCPRCRRANPVGSAYCWFDGGSLLSDREGVQRLTHDFIFPSGRRCATLEDFAQACHDEWSTARDLLSKDAFRQFFTALGRADLVRLSQEAMQQSNPDVRLARFVDGLPIVRANLPKLDLQPRRFTLGRLPAGDKREIELTLVNTTAKGTLQGTVTITEGGDFLSFPDSPDGGPIRVQTATEQRVRLVIDASRLQAAQSYAGRLMVVTSGGVAEVPVRFDLVARPFAKAPFQGVRSPRELAEKMRHHPKQAGPLLESGDVERWFSSNNWDYPVEGAVAKGIAGVQQFFEAMGLSRPPQLQLSQKELRFSTHYPDPVRFQVAMQTSSRKWVYGQVSSDRPWMKVLTPTVIGPQQANILLEADPTKITVFPPEPCRVQVRGNGGQKLDLNIVLDVRDIPRPPDPTRWRWVFLLASLFLAMRLLLIPVIDFQARGAGVAAAVSRLELPSDTPLTTPGGSLAIPWVPILAGFDGAAPLEAIGISGDVDAAGKTREFRHAFVVGSIRRVIGWLWWVVPVGAVAWMILRGGFEIRNVASAIVAGSVAGVLASATLACVALTFEIVPHAIWTVLFGRGTFLPAWLVVAALSWTLIGAVAGVIVALMPRR